MQILLERFLFHQCHLQERADTLCCNLPVHNVLKHHIGNAKKQKCGRSSFHDFLMQTVFVDQADFTPVKSKFIAQNFLPVFSVNDIKQFQIFV